MINDEISNRAANIEIRVAKATASEILKQIKKLFLKAKQHGGLDKLIKAEGTEVKLKDMVKKGQLEEINVKDGELKELRKELNKNGVYFSVMKDKETGVHSIFFQAKDTKVMDKAFKNVLSTIETKEKIRSLFIKPLAELKKWLKVLSSKIRLKISKRNKAYDG